MLVKKIEGNGSGSVQRKVIKIWHLGVNPTVCHVLYFLQLCKVELL